MDMTYWPQREAPTQGARVHSIPAVKTPERRLFRAVKRAFDLLMGLFASVVCAVPMLVIGLCVRLDSPGPALYKQERLGKNGVPFMMYKFRSMRQDAEKDGPRWAADGDCRCTRLGRWLRRSRLDELPQFWNILRGDMSFVGPRPERACFYEEFEQYIDGFSQRLAVTPGLTGYAQVCGGYRLPPEEKILFDMEYIENQSVWMDLKCLVKTVAVVLTGDGAR